MTTAKTRTRNTNLDPFVAASRIVKRIADEPSTEDILADVRAEVAKRLAENRARRQAAINAIVECVAEKNRETMRLAVLQAPGGLCGFDLAVGANDAALPCQSTFKKTSCLKAAGHDGWHQGGTGLEVFQWDDEDPTPQAEGGEVPERLREPLTPARKAIAGLK